MCTSPSLSELTVPSPRRLSTRLHDRPSRSSAAEGVVTISIPPQTPPLLLLTLTRACLPLPVTTPHPSNRFVSPPADPFTALYPYTRPRTRTLVYAHNLGFPYHPRNDSHARTQVRTHIHATFLSVHRIDPAPGF
ncbi:hypothetical protein NUW54_g8599 [Trametes sanguinea]|uniref:Uncharacterized protein n=1 Tax=Trametes sanguinea TaxID=158606 RepID=A0ACC1PFC1_9APHY|nr:hypothetical protein NUW54_g8599 [Trametes sanguinea]